MNWLRKNPLGAALLGLNGLMALVLLMLWWAWDRPLVSGASTEPTATPGNTGPIAGLDSLGDIANYQVVNERPVFNASRRPEIRTEGDAAGEEVVDVSAESVSAPNARLTGVVITPQTRFVSLTPAEGGESVVIAQGQHLEGEWAGWSVANIDNRQVELQSARGETVKLDLALHDQTIKLPPKPKPATRPEPPEDAAALEAEAAVEVDEEGEPLSRADEIRRRIEERREQLRSEAEQQEGEQADKQARNRSNYQNAIQKLMQGGKKDKQGSQTDESE